MPAEGERCGVRASTCQWPRERAVAVAGYGGIATELGLAKQGRDIVLVEQDPDRLAARATMRRPVIIDGRRPLPETELRAQGYTVERVGDGVDRGSTTGWETR